MQLWLISDRHLRLAGPPPREARLFGQVSPRLRRWRLPLCSPPETTAVHLAAKLWNTTRRCAWQDFVSPSYKRSYCPCYFQPFGHARLRSPHGHTPGTDKDRFNPGAHRRNAFTDFNGLWILTLMTSSRFAITCQVPLSVLSIGLFYPSVSTVIKRIKVRYWHLIKWTRFYFYQYKCDRFPAANP